MSWANYDDVKSQLQDAGLILDKPLELDSRIQRWKVDGEDRERRGWTKLREWQSKAGSTFIVGAFGVWRGNDDGYQRIELSKQCDSCGARMELKAKSCPSCKTPAPASITNEDLEAIKAAHKEAARKLAEVRKAEIKRAASWAESVWGKCTPCEAHEYLERKQIKPHGLRMLPESLEGMTLAGIDDSNAFRLKSAAGALVVPMHDAKGAMQGLQFIYAKGHPRRTKIERDKEFWPSGMAMGGTFGMVGTIKREGVMLIAEGYATAASLHESTGQTVAYAFAANNLLKAGKQLGKEYPRLRFLFCADDDYIKPCHACKKPTLTEAPICAHCGAKHGQENTGAIACSAATAEIERSAWVKPIFPKDADGKDLRDGKKLTDFNDLLVMTGLPLTLADQINAKLSEMKWNDSVPRWEPAKQGGGEDGSRRSAVSVMSLDDAVERFIPLDDGTGKYLFDTWTSKIVLKDQMVALLPAGVRGDIVKSHPVWTSRGAYYLDQVGFDPAGNDSMVKLNTWKGWPIKPKRGSCERLLELIDYLCSGEKNGTEVVKWLLCWMAYPLQNPGAKMNSAVIMHGPQGTGKSTVFQSLAKIYGDYSTVLNQRGLEDKFNADWSDSKLFILAEEVVTRAEMWHIKNELKELVTGEWIRVNPKNVAAYRQRNHVNIIYLSNEGQPLPLDNDDRRHCVVWTPPELGAEFYDEVFIEQENGGIEAFYHYLMHIDLSDFHPKKRPPMTDSKEALINLSMPSEDRFVRDWIAGDIVFRDDVSLPFCACGSDELYAAYKRWCAKEGEQRPRAQNQFSSRMARRIGWEKGHRDRYADYKFIGDKKRQRMITPSDHDMNEAIKRGGADYRKKDDENVAQWATRCFFDFKTALGGDQ
jgi:putative DNA primase/helicase